ncbi:MAG: uracil-DNA glycosylase [Pseudomonadota bacterium]|nr:uracil-DNA glycosylase [Pseudomonadota bacterium]
MARMDKKSTLEWHMDAGVDEATGDQPVNHFKNPESAIGNQKAAFPPPAAPQSPIPNSKPLHHSPSAAMAAARELADKATTLAELKAAVEGFEGCALKKTASKTIFSDGNPQALVMVIGEAPGAQEDIQGIPFCGPSGQLLDRTLASIGLTRAENTYISNTVFWRPPGNRQPTPEETAICLPFVEKHIALIHPKLLLLSGGVATTTMLKTDAAMSRMRGKFYEYGNPYLKAPIPVAVTYHPSYLLRSPGQKRLAWGDMLMIKEFLNRLKLKE